MPREKTTGSFNTERAQQAFQVRWASVLRDAYEIVKFDTATGSASPLPIKRGGMRRCAEA
jgi:hypothetical protein